MEEPRVAPTADPQRHAGPGSAGLWSPSLRITTLGLVFTVTLVAFEALAVITILPIVSADLGGVALYGWVISAFSLGSLLGIVVGGAEADRRGPASPFTAGLLLFAAGLTVGGLAPTMLVLVLARGLQGVGAGVIPSVIYASVGRSYPEAMRPRLLAILSTAWVIPSVLGPSVSVVVAVHAGWRWVFLGLLPLVAIAGLLTLVPLRRLGRPAAGGGIPARVIDAVRVAAGAGLVITGMSGRSLLMSPVLVLAGALVGVGPLLRVLPRGTLRARPGLPAAVLARGLLTFAFFGADTFLPLALTSARGQSPTLAGVAVTSASLTWTLGAWFQERRASTWGSRRLVVTGMWTVVAGIAVSAMVLVPAMPVFTAVAGWLIAGLGIGMAYAQISVAVLKQAPPGREGSSAAAMQLSDNLGVAAGSGLGGAAVAAATAWGWGLSLGLAVAFGWALAMGALGCVVGLRLPGANAGVQSGAPHRDDTAPARRS